MSLCDGSKKIDVAGLKIDALLALADRIEQAQNDPIEIDMSAAEAIRVAVATLTAGTDEGFHDRLYGMKLVLILDPNADTETGNEVELTLGMTTGTGDAETAYFHAKDESTLTAGVRGDAVELTLCCGREECGGECGNEWRGTAWYRKNATPQPARADEEVAGWATPKHVLDEMNAAPTPPDVWMGESVTKAVGEKASEGTLTINLRAGGMLSDATITGDIKLLVDDTSKISRCHFRDGVVVIRGPYVLEEQK